MPLEEPRLTSVSSFSITELKQKLADILDHGPNVCVRFRLLGEMWQTNFVRIVSLTDNRAMFKDEIKNQLISIDLNNIVQFEIDHRFKGLEPYNHYAITLH